MKYRVVNFFTDLQDNDHPYEVGDEYPRDGLKVSKKRIAELSGTENKQHKQLIEAVEEQETEQSTNDDVTGYY